MDYRQLNDLGGLTVRYMQIFLVAAESGNFSITAEQLNTTQPLVSRTIALMESELQVKLFHRYKKNMELTDAGRLLYTHWKTVLSMLRVSVDEARFAEQKLERPCVILDEIVSDKQLYLYPFLFSFRERYPQIKTSVELMDTNHLIEYVRNGSADIAFTMATNTDRMGETIVCREIISGPLYAWVHESNPLSGKADITVEELTEEPIAIIERSAAESYNEFITSLFARRGLTMRVAEVCPNPQSFEFLRQNTNITTITNEFAQTNRRRDVKMLPIRGERSGIVAFWNKRSKSCHLERVLATLDLCMERSLFNGV